MFKRIGQRIATATLILLLFATCLILVVGCGGETSSTPALATSQFTSTTSSSTTLAAPPPAVTTSLSPVPSPIPSFSSPQITSASPSTSAPVPSNSPKAPTELAYDDGVADGWNSSGGQQQYGYLVRFTPGVPYTVNKIKIFSYLPQPAQNNPQFGLRITDKNLVSRWDSSFPYSDFTSSGSWLEISVPGIAVDGEFCVLLYAPTLGKDLGPFIGVDTSSPNTHSQVIAAWALSEWTAGVPKEKANWMIRVVGN
jgi:hypothetical protein